MVLGAGLGFIVGLVPLILGFVKKNLKYGAIGFILSIIGGTLLGIFLALPAALIFSWLILRKPKPAESNVAAEVSTDGLAEDSKEL